MRSARLRRQRGALSLLWCAVAAGAAAAAAMLVLLSIRHERNPLADMQEQLKKAPALQYARHAAEAMAPSGAPIRKCMINGKTVYSNTECNDGGKPGRVVELHDTRGIEAPRAPAAASPAPPAAPDLREQMIERAVSR